MMFRSAKRAEAYFCRLSICKTSTAVLAMIALSSACIAETTSVECVDSKTTFDGVAPLQYAKVTSPRLRIFRTYPQSCEEGEGVDSSLACESIGYLVADDDVAVSKTCSNWSFIEFIGARKVSVGWVAADQLRPDSNEGVINASLNGDKSPLHYFVTTLKKGRGRPVCEAYLQRMNQTYFELPPFCGRPESNRVPGFEILNRIWMPTSQINDLQFEAERFIGDQPANSTLGRIPYDLKATLASYGFAPWIAIENDGKKRNVILWNVDDRAGRYCNQSKGPIPFPDRSVQVALILSNDGKAIDRQTTRNVFGQPKEGPALPGHADQSMKHEGAAQLGNSYGVFKYRGEYFFDTFFDNGPNVFEHLATSPILENTLGVFIRRANRTSEICELSVDQ